VERSRGQPASHRGVAARLLHTEGKLVYAGRAGTGLPAAELERLWQRLQPLVVDKMQLAEAPPRGTRFGSPLVLSRVHWVKPDMVVEVSYVEWTPDGLLRHVVYLGENRRTRSAAPRHNRGRSLSAFAAGPNVERDSRQDPLGAAEGVSNPEGAGAETRFTAAPEKLRAAARGVIPATVKGQRFRPADDPRICGGCPRTPNMWRACVDSLSSCRAAPTLLSAHPVVCSPHSLAVEKASVVGGKLSHRFQSDSGAAENGSLIDDHEMALFNLSTEPYASLRLLQLAEIKGWRIG
jgi:hypothetical protein